MTDPSGAQTQFGYNYNYGLISSLTDPNGLITSWQYTDGFGRKTLETRPDGTYTTWTYNDCSAWGGCLFGSNALAVAQNVYNSDHSIQADGSTYFDQADRLVMSNAMMLGGTTYTRKERRYDSLGRIAQQAAPCTWTSVSAA